MIFIGCVPDDPSLQFCSAPTVIRACLVSGMDRIDRREPGRVADVLGLRRAAVAASGQGYRRLQV